MLGMYNKWLQTACMYCHVNDEANFAGSNHHLVATDAISLIGPLKHNSLHELSTADAYVQLTRAITSMNASQHMIVHRVLSCREVTCPQASWAVHAMTLQWPKLCCKLFPIEMHLGRSDLCSIASQSDECSRCTWKTHVINKLKGILLQQDEG